jgi:hypothetical protein
VSPMPGLHLDLHRHFEHTSSCPNLSSSLGCCSQMAPLPRHHAGVSDLISVLLPHHPLYKVGPQGLTLTLCAPMYRVIPFSIFPRGHNRTHCYPVSIWPAFQLLLIFHNRNKIHDQNLHSECTVLPSVIPGASSGVLWSLLSLSL